LSLLAEPSELRPRLLGKRCSGLARVNFGAPSSLSTERLVDDHRSHKLARFGGMLPLAFA
jgi:hypothetical protein